MNGKQKFKRYACHLADYTVNARSHAEAVAKFRSGCSGVLTADVYLDGPDFVIIHNDNPDPSLTLPHSLSTSSPVQGSLPFPD